MSTKYHPQTLKYVFFVTEQVMSYIMLAKAKTSHNIPDGIQSLLDAGTFDKAAAEEYNPILAENGFYDWQTGQEFCAELSDISVEPGEVFTSYDLRDRTECIIEKNVDTYEDAPVIVIEPDYEPAMFGTASYSTPEQLVSEFKRKLAQYDVHLPESFDWYAHIVDIDGVCFD